MRGFEEHRCVSVRMLFFGCARAQAQQVQAHVLLCNAREKRRCCHQCKSYRCTLGFDRCRSTFTLRGA